MRKVCELCELCELSELCELCELSELTFPQRFLRWAIWVDGFCQIKEREKRDKSFRSKRGSTHNSGFYLYRVDLERKRLGLEKKLMSQPRPAAEKLCFV